MRKKTAILCMILLWTGIYWTKSAKAENVASEVQIDFGTAAYKELIYGYGTSRDVIGASCYNNSSKEIVLEVSSSNPNVVELAQDTERTVTVSPGGYHTSWISYQAAGVGVADIVLTVQGTDQSYRKTVYVMPKEVEITNITQTAFQGITLQWKNVPGCSGYIIERALIGQDPDYGWLWEPKGDYQNIAVVSGGNTASAAVPAEWDIPYRYRVIGFVESGAHRAYTSNYSSSHIDFTARKLKAQIASVAVSGKTNMTVSWNRMEGASAYKVYRSTAENGAYACIYTADAGTLSYTQKVSKGVTYYYKVTAVVAGVESDFSESISRFIPKKGKAKTASAGKLGLEYRDGQYVGNWASSDRTYYYTAGGKLYALCAGSNKKLNIFRISDSLKIKKVKTIKLSYDVWGGFYAGPDGNFYVAVGYENPTESKTKTVIKIIQYNGKWKKGKTAEIAGGASNQFVGIYAPFRAGNLRMDMQGNMLYVMTARQMFQSGDGLRHQSDISFLINTETMKEEKGARHPYVSHSFNQFVKFKDGNIARLDHGDAYPRSLVLSMEADYGLKAQKEKAVEENLFSFQGAPGDNYTGCKVGGMEIGESSVLVCGTSQPHNRPIKGVSGYGDGYKQNVFLALADKKTFQVKFIWLTNYHPKNTSVAVGETRMIKLSDDRFAILYTTTSKGKEKLNYVVVDSKGKKIYSKKYSGMIFKGASQPILYKGNIIWADFSYNAAYQIETKLCSIPAVY